MSYDDNFIKTKKTHIYFNSLQANKKRKHNNSTHAKFQHSIKANNKLDNKFARKNQKQLTLGPLSSTLETTISSPKLQNDEDNSSLSSEMHQKITINTKKLLKPQDEDIIIIKIVNIKINRIIIILEKVPKIKLIMI